MKLDVRDIYWNRFYESLEMGCLWRGPEYQVRSANTVCILLTDKIELYSHAFLWLCCVRHEILPIYNVVSIKSIYFIKCFSISHIGAIGLCTVTAVLNVILDDKLSNF